jgi:squalene-hopene/tetraprenyl-beta-curcumene cyclase
MTRTTLCAVSLFACAPLLAACTAPVAVAATSTSVQGGDSTPRQHGTIFKHDIDDLIEGIAAATEQPGTAAPYSTELPQAAQILCAMGHCHRFYMALDNPRIRATVATLIQQRREDGSFGQTAANSAASTAWVVDALAVMDAERYRDEIAVARAWLAKNAAADTPSWQSTVSAILAKVRQDVFPEHLGREAAASARKATAAAHLDLGAATAALVQLVACQTANRLLDHAQEPAATAFSPAQHKAFEFLMSQQKDGVFMATYGGKTFPDPAFTGFGLLALQTKPKAQRTAAESKVIDQGLQWLLAHQNDDGSFGQQVQNYTTSVVVGALARWNNPAAEAALQKAQKYLLKCQHIEQSGYQSSDRDYGSIGYGDSQRGDLSNVHFALQALRESGLPANDEALQKAIVFLQRSQNLKSVNDFAGKVTNPDEEGKLIDIAPGNDGGGVYYPGNSAAGYLVTPDGKSQPRSYGSMTYALLKSYTLCGVDTDDPRVKAAVGWISSHWTLAENPGFDVPVGDKARYAGLFYYYMVLAQALDLAGVQSVEATTDDGKPKPLEWRKALRAKLESMQAANGSWTNDKNSRWMEGSDLLCTFYAMLALDRCH